MLDQKKVIASIMSRRKADGSTSSATMAGSDMKSEPGEPDPKHAAAEDIIMAMKEGHAGKLTEAMSAFHDLHMMERTKSEDTEPEVKSGPASEE